MRVQLYVLVVQLLTKLYENENEKSTFPIHTPIIIHTSVNMSEVVDLGPRSAAFGAKSLSPLIIKT